MSESLPPPENLGVVPMPSKESHMALLADIKSGQDAGFGPPEPADSSFGAPEPVAAPAPAPATEPLSFTAYKAARGPAPEQATQALAIAKSRGVSPQFAADNLDAMKQVTDQSGFEDALGVSPVLAAYAGQSAVHASAVKDDVTVLQALEMGLADVGYGAAARRYMDNPASEDPENLAAYEQTAADYAARQPGLLAEVARAIPSVAAYGAASVLGTAVGGPTVGTGGMGTALYQLNRGVLYRRIWQQAPIENPDFDPAAFDVLAKKYAKDYSLAGATLGALFGDAFTRALPFANKALASIGQEIAAQAAAESLAKAGAQRGAEFVGHTLSGAMLMATQAVADDAAVQKATTGKIDTGMSLAAGKDAFLGGLSVAAALSLYTPGRAFLSDLGRIRSAPADVAHLDGMVESAKASKLAERAPAEFEQVVGQMAAKGDTPTVYVSAEVAQKPEIAAKLVEALADEGRALAEAQATGGDVAVPTEKYLSVLKDEHAGIREDVKLSPEGATLKEAHDFLKGPVARLLAERTAAQAMEEGPERRAKLQDIHERMRDAVAAQYGGTSEDWNKALTKDAQDMIGAGLSQEPKPPPRELSILAARAAAHSIFEEKPIVEIHPGRYNYAAGRLAQKAIDLAVASIQKGSRDTLVITPQRPAGEAARYELVEAKDLIPSHSPNSFTPNAAYPQGVQERFYQGQPEEQLKVTQGAARLNPALLLANTPSPLDGPPIVTAGARKLVLGGNGRAMMIQRAFADDAVRDRYREALTQRAGEFGLAPEDVQKMKSPVLVRVLPGTTESAKKADLVGAVRRFNEGLTQQLSPQARALAEAKSLTPQTVQSIGTLLYENDEASLRDVLRDRPREVLDILRRDGVVNDQNQAQWVAGGDLTKEAKDRIENMFVGRVVENESRLNATAPEVLKKIERAAPFLLRVEGMNPALGETRTMREAIDLLNEARLREMPLSDLLSQGNMFRKMDPAGKSLARFLDDASQREVSARFKAWADYAAVDPRQVGMFDTTPTLPGSLGVLLNEKEAKFADYVRAAPEEPVQDNAPALAARISAAGRGEGKTAKPQKAGGPSELLNLHSQHVQAHEMAAVAVEVRAEMGRLKAFIDSRDTDTYRAQLAKADPAYLGAFDALMEAIDENTPRAKAPPGVLDMLFERMDRDAEPLGFDAEKLQAILDQPKGWKGLTPPEARVVVDAVKNIRAAARRVNEITLADRKETLREFVGGVRSYLDETNRPDSGLPAPSVASSGPMERAGKTVDKIAAELLQPMRILRDRLGEPGNAIADTYVKSRNAKEELARQVGDHFYRAYEIDLPKELKKSRFDGVNGPGSPAFADNKWVRQDLWEFASWWGSESGSDRIKAGLRISDSQAHQFMSQLTKAEADFLEAKWKLNDEKLWPLIRDHQKEVTGTAPPKIEARPFTIRTAEGDIRELHGGYEPARYRTDLDSTATAPEEAQSIADYWGTLRDGFDSTAKYFTKERAQNSARVPDLNWSMYAGHVNSVLHYLAFDDFVRNTGRIFRDPEFRELIQRRLGPQEMIELDKFLGTSARGFIESGMDGASNLNRFIGNGLRGRWATAAFQLNPRIILGQTSHYVAAIPALKLTPTDILFGLSEALRPNTWGKSFDASEQLPYRWDNYSRKMREMLANIGPSDKPSSRKWLDAAGWSGYHVMDGFLSKAIYESAASKAERAGADPTAARQAGDRAVELMMPPLNLAEQSSFARDRGVVGALLLVRNFPNTLYNVAAKLEWDARNEVLASDPGWQRAKTSLGAYGAAAASYLGTVWAAHILGRFLMGHGRQPDESSSEWLEREALTAPFYPVPFGEAIVAPLAEAAVTHKTLSQAVQHHGFQAAPAIAELEQAVRNLGKVVGSGATEDRVFAGLRLAANALRLPSEPLKGIRYGYDLTQGNVSPRGPFDVGGGFFYGQRRRQPKNPATLTQDWLSGD